jgi:hypothetical protein
MNQETCCPKFDPEPWNDKELTWKNEKFITDRVTCFFHIPLNFGSKMVKHVKTMEAAGAIPSDMIVLANKCSLWGMDIHIKTAKEIPNTRNTSISGRFLSKVFEGPFKNTSSWIRDMNGYVRSKGKEAKDLYFYYTTCPKCAKKYGKNYVVLLAKID